MKRLSFITPRRSLTLLSLTAALIIATLSFSVLAGAQPHYFSSSELGTVGAFSLPTVKTSQTLPPSKLHTVVTARSTFTGTAAVTEVSGCSQNGPGKLLLVSISQQHLWACDGTQLVNESAVTTGTTVIVRGVNDRTPTGTWHIYGKHTNTVLRGCDANGCWDDPVQYWMPFDGEVGFHDASWQTFPFGASNYHADGSHGCVHLPTPFAAWVYGWAPIGTKVTVEN